MLKLTIGSTGAIIMFYLKTDFAKLDSTLIKNELDSQLANCNLCHMKTHLEKNCNCDYVDLQMWI